MIFSIRYNKKDGEGYTSYAVDWNWEVRNQWARSEKEGVRWYPEKGLDKESYEAIIKRFGLEEERKNLTLEKMVTTSPKELGIIRRKAEKENKLPYLEIKSDVGDYKIIP